MSLGRHVGPTGHQNGGMMIALATAAGVALVTALYYIQQTQASTTRDVGVIKEKETAPTVEEELPAPNKEPKVDEVVTPTPAPVVTKIVPRDITNLPKPIISMPTNLEHLPSRQKALELYAQLDVKKNQRLPMSALQKNWNKLFKLEHKAKVADAFKTADKNHDRMIERQEFEAFLRYIVYYDKFYDAFSLDGDRHVVTMVKNTFQNVGPKHLCVNDPDKVFDLIEKRHKDKITYEEFCSWLARHTCQWELQLGGSW